MPGFQSRSWVFTLNNPDSSLPEDEPSSWDTRYIVYQLEEGENGTVHWQGYCMFEVTTGLTKLKKVNPRVHWEARRGTHEEARAYCTKQGALDGPFEYGVPPSKGGVFAKKTTYNILMDMVKEGASSLLIAETIPSLWFRHRSNILSTRALLTPDRDFVTEVVVYWGRTGLGKSRRAYYEAIEEFGARGVYFKMRDSGAQSWWDEYEGQPCVIINDFYGWIRYDDLLRLLDRYPQRVPIKGGFSNFVARKVYITSNEAPDSWYPKVYETLPFIGGALERRLSPPQGRTENLVVEWVPPQSAEGVQSPQ